MLLIDFLLFSYWGFLIWAVQMIWIPFWAAGVINGIGHYFGYRNDETRDHSRNIVPWGIMIGGEELHNNHHINPASAKLSMKWYEFDIGWLYIRIFKSLRLLSVR
jgi:stearoyl-CoA desaturase (delta-9 desaturase)